MANETAFLNNALSQIGAPPITAIDDGTPNANWCQTLYPILRKAWLRSHHWNFAETRKVLVLDVTPPAFEYPYAYILPTDCLKIKEFNGSATVFPFGAYLDFGFMGFCAKYKIEGRRLLTFDSVAMIVYVQDITNPDLWDPLFYQFLSTMLASQLATAISTSQADSESLARKAMNLYLPTAVAVDGQEGSIQPYIVDDLTRGR